jgi:hypothetical protein
MPRESPRDRAAGLATPAATGADVPNTPAAPVDLSIAPAQRFPARPEKSSQHVHDARNFQDARSIRRS